eukprot:7104433-Ditylum_brightwellii.AAC.1
MKSNRKGNHTSSGGQGKGKEKFLSEGDKDKNKRDCQNDGHYDGKYYPSLHDHDEWPKKAATNKEARKQKHEKEKKASGSSENKTKLVLNNNLKAFLCTNCGLLDERVASMIKVYKAKN